MLNYVKITHYQQRLRYGLGCGQHVTSGLPGTGDILSLIQVIQAIQVNFYIDVTQILPLSKWSGI